MVLIKVVCNKLENTLQLGESKKAFPKNTDSSHEGWECETSRNPKHTLELLCPCRARKRPHKNHPLAAGTETIAALAGTVPAKRCLPPTLLSSCNSTQIKSLPRSTVFGWPSFHAKSLPSSSLWQSLSLQAESWLQRERDMSFLPFRLCVI